MLEEVKGVVIGSFYRYYEFWEGVQRIAKGHFVDDDQAEAWFKESRPECYEVGVEMRVWE